VLTVRDLVVHYDTPLGAVKAADRISFSLRAGERLGFAGESGSGKSTMALAILRMIKPPGRIAAGEVRLDGQNLLTLSDEDMRRVRLARIALIPQGSMNALNPVMRVKEQITDALRDHGVQLSGRQSEGRVRELLESVGLRAEVADMFPHELSGGMKQRACIAIAISLRPRVIIADEPTSALDVVTQAEILKLFKRLNHGLNMAVLYISHDLLSVSSLCHRVAILHEGEIVECAETEQIFRTPQHPYTRRLIDALPKNPF